MKSGYPECAARCIFLNYNFTFFQHVKCETFLFSLTQEQCTKIPLYLYCNIHVQMAINSIIFIIFIIFIIIIIIVQLQVQLLKVPIKS